MQISLIQNVMLKSKKIEGNPQFKKGDLIIVSIINRPDIKGRFIEWKDKPQELSGMYLIIEQTYENFILGLAYLLDRKLISTEEFKVQIEEKEYLKKRIRKISNNQIYRINNKFYTINH
jgi:hypothetical protein